MTLQLTRYGSNGSAVLLRFAPRHLLKNRIPAGSYRPAYRQFMAGLIQTFGEVDSGLLRGIHELLDSGYIGSAVYRETTESTNSDALGDLSSTTFSSDTIQTLPRLYLCDHQTAGRGRHGNRWLSSADSLTFSFITQLRLGEDSVPASIIVGVAVARALEHLFAPHRIGLKWPNDIYLQNRKAGGILIENSPWAAHCPVIGIGLNLNSSPNEDKLAASQPDQKNSRIASPPPSKAISLSESTMRVVDRSECLEAIVQSIFDCLGQCQDEPRGKLNFQTEYQRRCVLTGHQVGLSTPDGVRVRGRCDGIDEAGRLIVRTEHGPRFIASGQAFLIRKNLG